MFLVPLPPPGSVEHFCLPRTSMPLSHSASRPCLEIHPPIIPILLMRKLRCRVLLRATHSSLQQTCPASPPPAASRRSQMEGARFYSTGRSESRPQGQRAGFSGRCPEILITGSAWRHSRPRRSPTFVSSKPRPLTLPSSGCPGGGGRKGSKPSLSRNVL